MKPLRPDFAAFYRGTLAPLRRYLARLLGDAAEAQDIAHDAYARVYPTLRQRELAAPQAYLFQTARRLALNRLRHQRTAATDSTDAATLDAHAAAAPGVAQQVMARQEWAHLEAALAALPPGCRHVLLLRKVELLSHDEIAQRLGISRSAVEKHCYRAIRLLRAQLADAENPGASARPAASPSPLPVAGLSTAPDAPSVPATPTSRRAQGGAP